MAAELGADIKIAKRAGLLHDLGKAVDHEIEGPHVEIGADLARRYKESKEIIHGIAAHHGDIEPQQLKQFLYKQLMQYLQQDQELEERVLNHI